eukprot:CAMPEP_0181269606 /NCGR_PEP_ID=MMETSP1097-20121128/6246_1 /TAXON_ID=35684 /ORGANISM="Pseudopedinella elastica, Strain CCMP716" /LENGTH=42 /DNA_ID= /DNA_START= /DNA_END= /DNA_ORIENTATION=
MRQNSRGTQSCSWDNGGASSSPLPPAPPALPLTLPVPLVAAA